MKNNWQIWIDTGGTFTDCIAIAPSGNKKRVKVLSSSRLRGTILKKIAPKQFLIKTNWATQKDIFKNYEIALLGKTHRSTKVATIDFEKNILHLNQDLSITSEIDFEITAHEEAPIFATRIATETPLHKTFPKLEMRLGSTKGTNALLEDKGAKVTFLVTKGFKDLIKIGTQQRPHLFQLDIPEPKVLYQKVIEVEERISAQGKVVQVLSKKEIERIVFLCKKNKSNSVAIALLHSYRNPKHEIALRKVLQKEGINFISCSEALSPAIHILPRAKTSLVNAYLAPIIHQYLEKIKTKLPVSASLKIMTSAGGLVDANFFNPKDSLLSGPAGGVVGAAKIANSLGVRKILTLDMGGTSTDTARFDGTFDYQYLTKVGDVELMTPSLAIETVAAGGGSICYFDGNKLCVGPESAGASPGPACYGAGGPLTITDVNLLLGKIDTSSFGIPVNKKNAEAVLVILQNEILKKTKTKYSKKELLEGFEKIANEKMAEAIRKISVSKGFAPSDYALLVFGGAGGLHACKIAELLHIKKIILPYDGGLLSAYGMGQAQIERLVQKQILKKLSASRTLSSGSTLLSEIQDLKTQAIKKIETEGFSKRFIEIKSTLIYLRLEGQSSTLEIPIKKITSNKSLQQKLKTDFIKKYKSLFGHFPKNKSIEVESIKVIAANKRKSKPTPNRKKKSYEPAPLQFLQKKLPVYDWDELKEGATIKGKAILLNKTSTAFIESGWQLKTKTDKNIILEFVQKQKTESKNLKEAIELELFTNRFTAIAEEMGAQLQRTAFSVNIKERLDFSCAILDADAELLVNAPHIPVHLGSLGICARLVLEKTPLEEGDVVITNHPKYGGSHLPDVTLLSGVFSASSADREKKKLVGYVINRAHHAEIGGSRPGSMPPDATCLAEEGVVLTPFYLVKKGKVQWKTLEEKLTTAKFPTRSLHENIADINAALASLKTGELALQKMVKTHGLKKVHHYMQALKDTSFDALKSALKNFNNKKFKAIERLDDGHQIHANINFGRQIKFDFTGTSKVHPFNLNANISIVYSAVIYALRLLCEKEIPLNEGLMRNVKIILPNSFLHPTFSDDPMECPAVVGGNTEVSQRLVDTLLKALGLAACSQGTMNNFLFGNKNFGYYETICGGVGAGDGFNGRSAVHQHMTNTKITDPEEMELRYAVRLHDFSVRKNSGGKGKWNGGNGIVRKIEFLENVEMTLISQHRNVAPFGLKGGDAGRIGQQLIIRKNGRKEKLKGVDSASMKKGDVIIIKTPGGGGFGKS